jgi:hypothetical protein
MTLEMIFKPGAINKTPNSDYMDIKEKKVTMISRFHEKNRVQSIAKKEKLVEKIIDYSQEDNNIIEIYELSHKKHVTKFYEYTPLVMIGEINFYQEKIQEFMKARFRYLFGDKQFIENFYQRVVDSYIAFIEATQCYFVDMSGNNIIANDDLSDFRILDVFSISEMPKNKKITFKPLEILISQKYKKIMWDEILNNFLTGCEDMITNIQQVEARTFERI